jgi:type IV pilus assembly protein PilB
MPEAKKRLGEMLIESGHIDEIQLNSALAYQRDWGGRLGSILIKKGFISENEILNLMGKQLGIPCISLEEFEKPSDELLNKISVDIAKKYQIFPIRFEGKSLLIATSDPTDLKKLDDIGFTLGVRIKPMLALESVILTAIDVHYEGKTDYGKTLMLDKAKLAEKVSKLMPSEPEFDPGKTASSDNKSTSKGTASKKDLSQKAVIESIIDLLIAKGIFTKDELMAHIKSKSKS